MFKIVCLMFMTFAGFLNTDASIIVKSCNYNTKDKCLDNWPCMWCNETSPSMYQTVPQNVSQSCTSIGTCGFNASQFQHCDYTNAERYIYQCNTTLLFLYLMMFIGYYISMIIIYGTVNRIMVNEDVSLNSRNAINTIVLMITSVPLFLFFFFNIVIFYVIFICYISLGVLVYCCFKVKDRDTDLNVIKAEKKTAYTAIN